MGVDPKDIDNVVYGNVIQSSTNAPYLNHLALTSGVQMEVPAFHREPLVRFWFAGSVQLLKGRRSIPYICLP
jgi:hypothetical protein